MRAAVPTYAIYRHGMGCIKQGYNTFVRDDGYSLFFSSHFNRQAYFRHCYFVSPHFPHRSVNTLAVKLKTRAYEPVRMLFLVHNNILDLQFRH